MALIAAHLNAEVILVVTVWQYVYNIPLPPPPHPLISLVYVKHHVYSLRLYCIRLYYGWYYEIHPVITRLASDCTIIDAVEVVLSLQG